MSPPRKKKIGKAKAGTKHSKLRVLVNYRDPSDPSGEEILQAHHAIHSIDSATVVAEIPGTIQIDVDSADADALRSHIQQLKSWDLSEEGIAHLPDKGSLSGE
jgi:hypothetical protein